MKEVNNQIKKLQKKEEIKNALYGGILFVIAMLLIWVVVLKVA